MGGFTAGSIILRISNAKRLQTGAEAYLKFLNGTFVNAQNRETGETIMQLNERLEICLLALTSRYPDHVVDINEAVLGPQPFGADGWTSHDMIELLHNTQPVLLHTKAYLIINTQQSAVYLPDYSEKTPAIIVHCRGKIPPSKGDIRSRQYTPQRPYAVLT